MAHERFVRCGGPSDGRDKENNMQKFALQINMAAS